MPLIVATNPEQGFTLSISPRREADAEAALLTLCRSDFAERAVRLFQTGDAWFEEPSAELVEIALLIYRNIAQKVSVDQSVPGERRVHYCLTDLETEASVDHTLLFQQVQDARLQAAEERELARELGCELLPDPLLSSAVAAAHDTLQARTRRDPIREACILQYEFNRVGVSYEQLEAYTRGPISRLSPQDIAQLWRLAASLREDQAAWSSVAASPSALELAPSPRPPAPRGADVLTAMMSGPPRHDEVAPVSGGSNATTTIPRGQPCKPAWTSTQVNLPPHEGASA